MRPFIRPIYVNIRLGSSSIDISCSDPPLGDGEGESEFSYAQSPY